MVNVAEKNSPWQNKNPSKSLGETKDFLTSTARAKARCQNKNAEIFTLGNLSDLIARHVICIHIYISVRLRSAEALLRQQMEPLLGS